LGIVAALAIIYSFMIRPAVIARRYDVVVRNPYRDVEIAWPAVQKIDVRWQLDFHTDKGVFHAWGIPIKHTTRIREARRESMRQARQARVQARFGRAVAGASERGAESRELRIGDRAWHELNTMMAARTEASRDREATVAIKY